MRAWASTALPEPGTGVWVEFEAGDPSYPIWTGCFWADNELPDPGGAPMKIWKTDKVTLRIDDDADELKMETTSESIVTLASDIKSESGGAKHTVGSSGSRERTGLRQSRSDRGRCQGEQRRVRGDVKWPAIR